MNREGAMVDKFQSHKGFSRTFKENKLTLGLLLPLESYSGDFPEMDIKEQITLVKKAEDLGFASLFVRDSPLYDPNFGDAGIMYDPFMILRSEEHTSELQSRGRLVCRLPLEKKQQSPRGQR